MNLKVAMTSDTKNLANPKTVNQSKRGATLPPLFENSYYTISQLSSLLNVPIKTIRHWVYRREVPHYKIGRHLRFNAQEIQKWIQERRIQDAH
jgi:excisionase family DNA binding protein